jgi:enamine deaminase RidA (YjgF/YER057c/UK114 family)
MAFQLLNPKALEAPIGYSHLAVVTGGKTVHVAGQAPFDASGRVVGKGDFVAQFIQVLHNLKTAVEAAGGNSSHYAVLTMYITDLKAYRTNRKTIGDAYRELFGKHFPAITLVEVKSLYNPECMVEISGLAVIE